jgi:hypothetical protein
MAGGIWRPRSRPRSRPRAEAPASARTWEGSSVSQAGVSAGLPALRSRSAGEAQAAVGRERTHHRSTIAQLSWRRPQTPPPGKQSFPPKRVTKQEFGNEGRGESASEGEIEISNAERILA